MIVRKLAGYGLAGIGGMALLGTVFGSDLRIYGQTGQRVFQEQLDAACGLGGKLEVLKTRVADLDREVVELRRTAAQRQVELEASRARVAEGEASVARQRRTLARAAELLDDGSATYEIAGRRYQRSTVEDDARAKLETCQSTERSLETERSLLAIKERTVDVARAHLERAEKRRGELGQIVRSLEARAQQQKAKRALADALDAQPISDEVRGQLAKAEALAKEVEQKLAVEERVLDERLTRKDGPAGTIDYEGRAKPERAETADVSRAIRAHLQPAKAAAPSPAAPAVEVH